MDIGYQFVNEQIVTPLIPNPPDWFSNEAYFREATLLFLIALVGGTIFYLSCAGASYFYFFWLRREKYVPLYRFNAHEIYREIYQSLSAIPGLSLLTIPFWSMDMRHTYKSVDEHGWAYLAFSVVCFLLFSDFCIYWLHRWLHHRWFYQLLHKRHHSFIDITPFASHAFNPVDGFIQSLPYHVFSYIMPFHNITHIIMFIFVNIWTVSIHDRIRITKYGIINGAAHHTIHHTKFVYNYGQYFTLWDRIGGSYKEPAPFPENTQTRKPKGAAKVAKKTE